jgi:hypothetical protein
MSEWRDQAAAESKLRQHAEEEVSQLRGSNQQFRLEARNSEITAEHFRSSFLKYTHCLNKILPLLKELKTEMPVASLAGLLSQGV